MIQVREVTHEELPIVRQIMLDAFEEYRGKLNPASGAHDETLEDVQKAVAEGGALLAFLDGEPAGSARYARKEGHVYCGRIAVLPAARGQGIAGLMLDEVHHLAKEQGFSEVRLSTREVMEANQRLYFRLGYEVVSREPHPKGDGIVLVLSMRLV